MLDKDVSALENKQFKDDFIYRLSYDEMLHSNKYPILTDDDKGKVKFILLDYDYDKLLKPMVYKLYKHTDVCNLLYCCLNLYDVRLIKSKLQSKNPKDRMMFRLIDGYYDKVDNLITYKRKSDISHELLHLASTKPTRYNTGKKSGFSYVRNDKKYNCGFNEGYTEMLNRRIFFNENYDTNSYRKKVYFMRLIELLYDNPKNMENDYFRADYKSFDDHVLRYASIDEFNYLNMIFDKMDFTVSDEEVRYTFELLESIVKRMDDGKKLVLSKQYTNEYFNKSQNKF